MYSKRAMPLSLRVASIYAMLVAATLLVAAGLALQFTRNQLSSQVDNQLSLLAKSFDTKVTNGVNDKVAHGWELSAAVVTETYAWLQNTSLSEGEGAVVAIRTAGEPKLFRPSGSYDLSHELEPVLPAVMSVSTAKWLNVHSRSGAAVRLLRVPVQDAPFHVQRSVRGVGRSGETWPGTPPVLDGKDHRPGPRKGIEKCSRTSSARSPWPGTPWPSRSSRAPRRQRWSRVPWTRAGPSLSMRRHR